MKKYYLSFLLIILSGSLFADKKINFNRDIHPILSDRCFHCHGPDEHDRKKKLRLDITDSKDGAYRIHKGKAAIKPGSPEESTVWQRIITDDEDDVMPPSDSHKKPLTAEEKNLIKQWIKEGAEYQDFWAFVPPAKQKIPAVKAKTFNPIDNFVLKELEENKINQKSLADKRTLIRRASLDITGLPPTPEEISTFLNDKSANAYEKLVDRFLAKSSYGEHMAKYWLDLVRFADTNGMHHDHYREMTPYRDWVIKSFNNNLKYDDFVRYQIAGDLYEKPTQEQLIASGFNRLHLIIDVGTALPEESYTKNVIDRVTAVGTAFMGLTVQCALCHDHKYDPISQKDFFALFAFFNNIDAGPETGGRQGFDFENGLQKPYIFLDEGKEKEPAVTKAGTPFWIWKEGKVTTEKVSFRKSFELKEKPLHAIIKTTCDNSLNLHINGKKIGNVKDWQQPLAIDVAKFLKKGKNEILVKAANEGDIGGFILSFESDKLSFVSDKSWEVSQDNKKWSSATEISEHGAQPWGKVLDNLSTGNRRAAMVMKERKDVRPAHILIRGQYDKLGEKVERGTPSFLPPLKKKNDLASRMDFAEWLVAKENPLTARVAVNRFWQQFFGVGLVKTSEDFGAQGEVPSHPELLDYLTVKFVESGWDIKALVKHIVTSKTYRLSSIASETEFKRDPENRQLARGSRFRMDSEMIRDQILATSGLLNPEMYGKSVKPPQPAGLWKSVNMPSSFPRLYKADTGDKIYRRSVYTFWKRGMPPPQMSIFNAPTRAECVARRERTNTPLQALLMFNEKEYLKASRNLAQKALSHSGSTDQQKLSMIYETITSKEADNNELNILNSLIKELYNSYLENQKLADDMCKGIKLDSKEAKAKLAAWTMAVSSIYNLDIVKTRE